MYALGKGAHVGRVDRSLLDEVVIKCADSDGEAQMRKDDVARDSGE